VGRIALPAWLAICKKAVSIADPTEKGEAAQI